MLELNLALAVLGFGLSSMMTSYLSVGHKAQSGYQQQQAQLVLEQLVAVLPVYAEQLAWLQAQSAQWQMLHTTNCWQGQICDQQQMLMAWWVHWQAHLAQVLPAGQLLLSCHSSCRTGGSVRLQVRWRGAPYALAACDDWHCLTLDWPL